MDSYRLWKLLRGPFVLPPCAECTHTCKWELFDTDQAGCLLCASLHRCEDGKCTLVEIEDGYVCSITAVVVQTRRMVMDEFVDTLRLDAPRVSAAKNCEHDHEGQILSWVEELLTSKRAIQGFKSDVLRLQQRFQCAFLHAATQTGNLLSALEQAVHCAGRKKCVFDMALRRQVVRKCHNQLMLLWPKCRVMTRRSVDVKTVVFGLMYMMRIGLKSRDQYLITPAPELTEMLPSEINLNKIFKFRAKNITDVENKIKFMFRDDLKTA